MLPVWLTLQEGIEFVKVYRAHVGAVDGACDRPVECMCAVCEAADAAHCWRLLSEAQVYVRYVRKLVGLLANFMQGV